MSPLSCEADDNNKEQNMPKGVSLYGQGRIYTYDHNTYDTEEVAVFSLIKPGEQPYQYGMR